jgi:biopolymer transport protein ExbD
MKPSSRLYTQHLSPHIAAPEADAAPLVEMNTTPLIDVLLVLIVMLIITTAFGQFRHAISPGQQRRA